VHHHVEALPPVAEQEPVHLVGVFRRRRPMALQQRADSG
jgi:hypothetical protein